MNDGNQEEPASGLNGHVLAKSDVQTIPDAPLEALVLAIPSEAVPALLAELSVEIEGDAPPARLDASLPGPAFEEYVTAHVRSSPEGAYALDIGPGRYWVCLADIGAEQSDPLPAYVNGCIEVTVPREEGRAQDIYWGEAGVTAQ